MEDFANGDFIADESLRVGVVCSGRRVVRFIGRKGVRSEIEVWFGEVGPNGLPVTCYVPADKCTNIRMARIVKSYFNKG